MFLLLVSSAIAVPPPTGVAPVTAPAGGFAIDGDLLANTPAANTGDWLPGTGGTGGSVLDATGAPLKSAPACPAPYARDKLMQPQNHYEKEVFNGDIGHPGAQLSG